MHNDQSLKQLLTDERFPRSNQYDPSWMIRNQMGLNPLWLTEWVSQEVEFKRNMRVLDLGCGKGLSSIFLAKEFKLEVWAADFWVNQTENHKRFLEAGVANQVFSLKIDARNMPFAESFFDAIICTDAFIYFGTDDLYLEYLTPFVKRGGPIAITIPGFMNEINGILPEHIIPFWAQECWTWHTVGWWRWHWERTGLVDNISADNLQDGWSLWLTWKKARKAAGENNPGLDTDIKVLDADKGRFMGFIRMIAQRK